MRHHNTLLHGLLQFIPWTSLRRACGRARLGPARAQAEQQEPADRSHPCAAVGCLEPARGGGNDGEPAGAALSSGRRAPKRSTLADANRQRPAEVFCQLFEVLLAQAHPGLRKASREAIRLIDATSAGLTAQSQGWAGYAAHGCGAKLHVVFDPAAALPVHFVVTPARVNDITLAKTMPIEPGATYVFDLGYYDFSWWATLDAGAAASSPASRAHTRPTLIEERRVEAGSTILADRIDPPGRPPRAAAAAIPSTGLCARSTSRSTPARSCASSATTCMRPPRISPSSTRRAGRSSCSSAGSSRPSKSAASSAPPRMPCEPRSPSP